MTIINIAKDFSKTPGARYEKFGPFSGQEFRKKFLESLFQDKSDDSEITIILDGVAGYATSFLEEAFGGLARMFGKEKCLKRLKFISEEDPLLKEEVVKYIENSG